MNNAWWVVVLAILIVAFRLASGRFKASDLPLMLVYLFVGMLWPPVGIMLGAVALFMIIAANPNVLQTPGAVLSSVRQFLGI